MRVYQRRQLSDDVIVGVDTHQDEHVAVLFDGLGRRLAELFIPATTAGFTALIAFCQDHFGTSGLVNGQVVVPAGGQVEVPAPVG